MKKAATFLATLFLIAMPAARAIAQALRCCDFSQAIDPDEKTAFKLLNYRLPEPFYLSARKLTRKTPLSKCLSSWKDPSTPRKSTPRMPTSCPRLTVTRYLENPADGGVLYMGVFRPPHDGAPFRIPVHYQATHWFVVTNGVRTVIRRLDFWDRGYAHLHRAYIDLSPPLARH